MSGYTVLANRYRPRTFDEVCGQVDVSRVLVSAIRTSRAGHAFLFSGPRGVGKTSMARILAKAFNCLENEVGEPCGECNVCRTIDGAGDCLDVVEIDGASHNKVENVRDLIENLRFRPVEARFRIYIVDEVHMLSTAAFNALLKTLEEPPAHAKFILATTEPLKVPETIRSRCQQFDFRRLTAEQIADRLADICRKEEVSVPDGLLDRLARHAQGGMRDALTLLDQLITYGEGAPTLQDFERLTGRLPPELLGGIVRHALAGDVGQVVAAGGDALGRGARPADLVGQLIDLGEGLLVTVAGGQASDRTDEERLALQELAGDVSVDHIVAMLDVLVEATERLRRRHDGRLVVEMALITLARLQHLQPLADALAGAAAGTPPANAPRPAARQPARSAPRRSPPATQSPPTSAAAQPVPEQATAAPAAPVPTPQAAPAAEPAPPATDFRTRFLASLPSRSLRVALDRFKEIRVEGDALLLVGPEDGQLGIHDPRSDRTLAAKLAEAAQEIVGRPLQLRMMMPSSGSSPTPSARSPAPQPSPAAADGPLLEAAAGAAASAPTPAVPHAPTSTPASSPSRRAGGDTGGAVQKRVEKEWPGAERVDF